MLSEAALLTGETATGRQKVGQVLGGAIPDDGMIGIELSVGQDVPEASNGPPGDLRLPRRYFGRQLLDRFTDDFEPSDDGIHAQGVGAETGEVEPG